MSKLKTKKTQATEEDSWQLIYIALMMVMMIFFLIMFMFYYIEGEQTMAKNINVSELSVEQVEQMRQIVDRVQDLDMGEQIRLIFDTPLMFESGRAELKDETPGLKNLAEFLANMEGIYILIEGHTDNVPMGAGGKFENNKMLSQYRALNILRYFEDIGVNSSRLVAVGKGEYDPVVPNDTPKNRAKNRRVEIKLSRKRFFQ
ncbi:MAG: OmpA/MotB family protein [Elusimicrobiota bacterium]